MKDPQKVWQTLKNFDYHLETGRTHQIRVHMKYIGYPLVGDSLYNPEYVHLKDGQADTACIIRQALHSHRLQFQHPITGKEMEFVQELPEDMAACLMC